MKKKILCGMLSLGLCLSLAQAAESSFTDVRESDWFAPYVSVCAESGLMNGTGNGSFSPGDTITVAECATIAARLLESSSGQAIPGVTPSPGEPLPWYQMYVGYLTANGVAVPEPTKIATRQELFDLLSAVTASEQLPAINSITALPDTGDQHVLAFYNAGILTGTDEYGTFAGDKPLSRSEVAAMVARLVKSELRLPFIPKPSPTDKPKDPGVSPSASVMTVNGSSVSADRLKMWINQVAYQMDSVLASYYGARLNLTDPTVAQAVLEQAKLQTAAEILMTEKATSLGCSLDQLPAALAPSPSRQELSAYVEENSLLCAKHILVTDEKTAQAVLDGLKAVPSLDQFNALLSIFGTDPGMQSNPNGYLFHPKEMVEEFENGTLALEVGTYSPTPVRSSYGYHIIWRLDPLDHPDLLEEYRTAFLDQQVNAWLDQAQIVVNDQALGQIVPAECYADYLEALNLQG